MFDKRTLTSYKRLTSFLFSLGGFAAALLCSGRLEAAAFTYPVNEKLFCSASCFIDFSGTITVDQLGNNLSLDDISDWNLQLVDNNLQKLQTFQPSNSGFKVAGSPVIDATSASLTLTLNQSADGIELVSASDTQWIFSGGQNDPTELVIVPNGNFRTASKPFSTFPATITADAFTATPAPEPKSAALLTLSMVGGLLCWRKRLNRVWHCHGAKMNQSKKFFILKLLPNDCLFRHHWIISILFLLAVLTGGAPNSLAQDTRHVTEPVFPRTCAVLSAPLHSTPERPEVGPTRDEQNAESKEETDRFLAALHLKDCQGQAVELALGRDRSLNAFLIDPIAVPSNVSLIVDGGVTVFGSRDPAHYQDPSTAAPGPNQIICGTYGPFAPVKGCIPLLSFGDNSGVYGYGILDGQGNRALLSGERAGMTWWDLTINKKCPSSNPNCHYEQSSPQVIGAGTSKIPANNFVLYKITIRNPPYHTVSWGGDGLTVWGVKVQAPWNLPNTDGFDLHGANGTVYDTTVANGDQDVTFAAANGPTGNITIDHVNAYSKGGIAVLGNGDGSKGPISNLLIENVNITGDLPSVVETSVNGVLEPTVNGWPESVLRDKYGLVSYGQALPNATNDLNGLQITTNVNSTDQEHPGADIEHVAFQSVCIQDIIRPIHVAPVAPFQSNDNLPTVRDITFQDIHVLAPTSQFLGFSRGVPDPSSRGSYQISFVAYPPQFKNAFTLSNVVIDDKTPGDETSLSKITAEGNDIITTKNVYPSVLNALSAPYNNLPANTTIGGVALTLNDNAYSSMTPTSSAHLAQACHRLPFLTGDLYLSNGSEPATGSATNLQSIVMEEGSAATLNAVVQPIMSQTTLFVPSSYEANPGLLAVGSPSLTNPIRFYDGQQLIGTASLSANGTLASLVVRNMAAGRHIFRAQYPADQYYGSLTFGSVTVDAQVRFRDPGDHVLSEK